jgi:GTP cyclohydrolase IA
MNQTRVEQLVRELLVEIGEDPEREGLKKTPHRVAASLSYLTSGYRANIDELINKAIFKQTARNVIVVKNIELYSLCEHHLLPFFGKCHIGYTPNGAVFGVSKLARLTDMYARRLQIQERLTDQLAHTVMETVNASGVGVIIEARHLCMMMRGVEKQNSVLTTSSMLGSFLDSHATRHEFLELVAQDLA